MAARRSKLDLVLWAMDANGQQPMPVTVDMPAAVTAPTTALQSKMYGVIKISNAFPDSLKEERLAWLGGGWFQREGENFGLGDGPAGS